WWDARHTLAVFGSVPIGKGWTLNAAYQGHSGRATTPVLARLYAPPPDGIGPQLGPRYLRGERNSIRVPPYHRLDLGLRRTGTLWGRRRHPGDPGAEHARPRQRDRLRLAAVLRLAGHRGDPPPRQERTAHRPHDRTGASMVIDVRSFARFGLGIALAVLSGACSWDEPLVPASDEPFLYLVLNQRSS